MILHIFFLFHTLHHIYSESTLAGVGSTDWEGVCVGGVNYTYVMLMHILCGIWEMNAT